MDVSVIEQVHQRTYDRYKQILHNYTHDILDAYYYSPSQMLLNVPIQQARTSYEIGRPFEQMGKWIIRVTETILCGRYQRYQMKQWCRDNGIEVTEWETLKLFQSEEIDNSSELHFENEGDAALVYLAFAK